MVFFVYKIGYSVDYLLLVWPPVVGEAGYCIPAVCHPNYTFQLLLGDPDSFPCLKRICNPSSKFRVYCRSLSNWVCSDNLRRHQMYPSRMPKPPQLTPFNMKEQWPYSEHPFSEAGPRHPSKLTHVDCLYLWYLWSHSFSQLTPIRFLPILTWKWHQLKQRISLLQCVFPGGISMWITVHLHLFPTHECFSAVCIR